MVAAFILSMYHTPLAPRLPSHQEAAAGQPPVQKELHQGQAVSNSWLGGDASKAPL